MSDHPLHRLEAAAHEYSKAARYCVIADQNAVNYSGARGERASVLATKARARKIACSEALIEAALWFAAWSHGNAWRSP